MEEDGQKGILMKQNYHFNAMTEYKGYIISSLGKGYSVDSIPFKTLKEAMEYIDLLILKNKK